MTTLYGNASVPWKEIAFKFQVYSAIKNCLQFATLQPAYVIVLRRELGEERSPVYLQGRGTAR